MTSRRALVAVCLLGIGLLGATLVGFAYPHLPQSGCTEVGYEGDPPGGFAVQGVDGWRIAYTPDGGVNRCSTHVGTVGVPAGALALGAAVLLGERSR